MIWPCFLSRLQLLSLCDPCSRFTDRSSVPPPCQAHLPQSSVQSVFLPGNPSHSSSSRVNQPSGLNLNITFSGRTSLTLSAFSVRYSFMACNTFPITCSRAVFHESRNNISFIYCYYLCNFTR